MIKLNPIFKKIPPQFFINTTRNALSWIIHKQNLFNESEARQISYKALVDVLGPDTPETPWENAQLNNDNVCSFLKDVSRAMSGFIAPHEGITDSKIFFSLLHQLAEAEVITL